MGASPHLNDETVVAGLAVCRTLGARIRGVHGDFVGVGQERPPALSGLVGVRPALLADERDLEVLGHRATVLVADDRQDSEHTRPRLRLGVGAVVVC